MSAPALETLLTGLTASGNEVLPNLGLAVTAAAITFFVGWVLRPARVL